MYRGGMRIVVGTVAVGAAVVGVLVMVRSVVSDAESRLVLEKWLPPKTFPDLSPPLQTPGAGAGADADADTDGIGAIMWAVKQAVC